MNCFVQVAISLHSLNIESDVRTRILALTDLNAPFMSQRKAIREVPLGPLHPLILKAIFSSNLPSKPY
jgi:hypothetical protein